MAKASESIQTKKDQHAHHGRHEDKDLQEIHECARIPINNKTRTHETKWSHQRIMDENKVAQKTQDTN